MIRALCIQISTALLCISVLTTGAVAQTPSANIPLITPPDLSDSSGESPELFGSITVTTDSRSQGFTSRSEDPSVEADVGVIWHNFYVGLSGSLVDLGLTQAGNKVGNKSISYYAGYVNVWRDITYDVGMSYSTFPGARDTGAELDYWEGHIGASRNLYQDLRAGVRIYYSPDFTANQGKNWIFEASLEHPLPEIRGITSVFSATLGYQEGDDARNNFDYWFWEAGVEVTVTKNINLDFRYHDTADVPFSCADQCGPAFVASMTLEY